jgi:hypothetical protein
MRTSIRFLMIATFIATTMMSMPAGSAPASRATAAKCKKVGDECLKSPLCLGGTTKNNCIQRCINKQANCLRYSSSSAVRPATKDGETGATVRIPVKPIVQQGVKSKFSARNRRDKISDRGRTVRDHRRKVRDHRDGRGRPQPNPR